MCSISHLPHSILVVVNLASMTVPAAAAAVEHDAALGFAGFVSFFLAFFLSVCLSAFLSSARTSTIASTNSGSITK